MHISITGDLGSGKSTISKELCKSLNFKFISTGIIQRELGLKKRMNTLEFNKYTDSNKGIDDYIDQHLKDINLGNESYVLDSRLAWFFVKKSFKVYLMTLDEEAAERILKDKNRIGEPDATSVKQKIADSKERRQIENNRFEKNYGAIFNIYKDFDLILDTSHATIEQITNLILKSYSKWKNNTYFVKIWFSPYRLYPLEHIRLISSTEAKDVKRSITENGFDESYPILILKYLNCFFIYDGHKRWSASLYNNISIVPISIVAKDDEEITQLFPASRFVIDSFSLSWIYDWEDAYSFRYNNYPDIKTK